MASITPENFDLDAVPPVVCVHAGYSKRRREDVLPLHPNLIGELRCWLADKEANEPVWGGNWSKNKSAGKMLQVDLKEAGIAYRDEAGQVADFHSLRHTFITRLGRAGVSVQQAKELARHSDVNLTLGVYQHLDIGDAASAINSLPDLPSCGPTTTAQKVAEADSEIIKHQNSLPIQLPIAGDFSGLLAATDGNPDGWKDIALSPADCSANPANSLGSEADGVRFELTIPLRELRFSRPVQSAALPPVQLGPLILGNGVFPVKFASKETIPRSLFPWSEKDSFSLEFPSRSASGSISRESVPVAFKDPRSPLLGSPISGKDSITARRPTATLGDLPLRQQRLDLHPLVINQLDAELFRCLDTCRAMYFFSGVHKHKSTFKNR